ncbi:interleukin-15 [Varanus komodoensis]|uniref:Interleukin n=1 Tax=Varanus komodoensis TaxID=61221 RepID=A0A8D2IPP0_VARKO|nr:interleukin-15 [Varanus komodoensis]XP_044286625.1 interleukin-15 [Varanus komodoensis]XP_044286627.1 interleukin-15 [Varanus komodoensis]
MYVIMNNYFWSSLINEPAVTIFVLCSYLLIPTSSDQYWYPVIIDLEKIENYSKIDVSLYTANLNNFITCNISVVRCFLLELEVILYESQIGDDPEFHDSVHRLVRSVTGFLSHRPHNEALKCQQCETFEEKPYAEFIKNFFSVARRFRMEELHPTRVTKKP